MRKSDPLRAYRADEAEVEADLAAGSCVGRWASAVGISNDARFRLAMRTPAPAIGSRPFVVRRERLEGGDADACFHAEATLWHLALVTIAARHRE